VPFTDAITAAIAAARPNQFDDIVRSIWAANAGGMLSDDEAQRAHETVEAQRTLARVASGAGPSRASKGPPRVTARRQRSPDRQASIERRRRLVASGPLPPPLAARFTWGEIAAMRIIGDECRAHGCCTLHIDAIAGRAGVCRSTVQNALREAQGRGEVPNTPIISVQERRRRGQRSLTNIIRIVSREWRDWLNKSPRWPGQGVGSNCTSSKKLSTTDTGLFLKGSAAEPPPWGIPDGVYACDERAER
jgi:hypothetical protein